MSQYDVAVIGEINPDLILYGLPEQMALGRELLAEKFSFTLGGSAAIVAHNLAAIGVNVGFATKIGFDPMGQICLDRLREVGAKVSYPKPIAGEHSGITIQLQHGDTRHILTHLGVIQDMTCDDIDIDFVASSRHCHFSSLYLQKNLHSGLPDLCRKLKQRGLTLSLDTNDDPKDLWGAPLEDLLDLVDVLLPNEDEAKRMTRTDNLDDAIDLLSRRVPVVAVKCGVRGSIVQARDARWVAPAIQVEVVDTIGAGDSFNAGFLKAYLAGLPMDRCATAGNAVAGYSTLQCGGTEAFRSRESLQQFLAKHHICWE